MGKFVVKSVVVGCALLASTPAFALTGNDWRARSDLARLGYVAGVVDTWNTLDRAQYFSEVSSGVVLVHTELMPCVREMTYGQISAIVENYMSRHPAKWHYLMPSLVWGAMDEVCSEKPRQSKPQPMPSKRR
jgi:hypothetical protein